MRVILTKSVLFAWKRKELRADVTWIVDKLGLAGVLVVISCWYEDELSQVNSINYKK